MIMNFLYFISGCFFTSAFFLIKKRKKAIDTRRRGIMDRTFTSTDNNTSITENIQVQIEILEIESSDTKSKIQVLEIIFDKSKFATDDTKSKLKDLINNSWVSSADIEWINNKSSIRNDKIDNLLN